VKLTSTSITDGEAIGSAFALAEPADEGHVTFAGNINPHLAWEGMPDSARSFAVECIDMDAPSVGDDGCAPPWNDSIAHRYTFTVYALDTEASDLEPGFSRDEFMSEMKNHIVDSASIMGTYATNPMLR
jgi:hypothetical protein